MMHRWWANTPLLVFLALCLGAGPSLHRIAEAWGAPPAANGALAHRAGETLASPCTDPTHHHGSHAARPCTICAWARTLTLTLDTQPAAWIVTASTFTDPVERHRAPAPIAARATRPRAPPALI